MFIFLASNYRTRYLDEIVRSLALPVGGQINLRYKMDWLSEKAKELVENQSVGDRCLICYIYYTASGSKVVPVRFGKIVSTDDAGSFVVITISVGKYPNCYEPTKFLETLKSKATNIPENPTSGFFFTDLDIKKQCFEGVSSGFKKDYWDNTVSAIKQLNDFQVRKYNFFRLEGVFSQSKFPKKKELCEAKHGFFQLKSGGSYQLKFTFLDTYSSTHKNDIVADGDNNVKYYTPTVIPIDTSYDVRQISFKTSINTFSTYGHINIDSNQGIDMGDLFGIDFDLMLKIKGNVIYNIVIGLIFGTFLFLASMKIDTSAKDDSNAIKLFIENNGIRYLISCIAGLVASFGIKKPFW